VRQWLDQFWNDALDALQAEVERAVIESKDKGK